MSQRHPLAGKLEWSFAQYAVGLKAPILVKAKKNSKARRGVITHSNTCREGLVSGIRNKLRIRLVRGGVRPNVRGSIGSIILDEDSLRRPGASCLFVSQCHITSQRKTEHPKAGQAMPKPPYWRTYYDGKWRGRKYPQYDYNATLPLTNDMVRDFLDFCNAIIGPITVLLNPSRFEGNWWRTNLTEAKSRKGHLCWYGIDNSVLAHPALVSLYSGLARQCALMVRCGVREQVLGQINPQELTECLNNSDPELALRLTRRMKKWIEVPVFRGGYTDNLPVPSQSFSKIPALHQALYQHGFDATFGKSLEEGWALTSFYTHDPYGGYYERYRGIHSFMGERGTEGEGPRIRKLAKTDPNSAGAEESE